jgi:hypothetical protein
MEKRPYRGVQLHWNAGVPQGRRPKVKHGLHFFSLLFFSALFCSATDFSIRAIGGQRKFHDEGKASYM